MSTKKNNVVDNFLELLDDSNYNKVKKRKVYKRVSLWKSVVKFGFAFICFILLILVFGFSMNVLYLFMLLGCILVMVFNGINIFTKDGIKVSSYEEVKEDDNMSSEDHYKVQ